MAAYSGSLVPKAILPPLLLSKVIESCSGFSFHNLSPAFRHTGCHSAVRPGSQLPKIVLLSHTQTSTHFIAFPTLLCLTLQWPKSPLGFQNLLFSPIYTYWQSFSTLFVYSKQNLKWNLSASKTLFLLPPQDSDNKQLIVCCYYLGRDSAERAAAFKSLLSSVVSQGCTLSHLLRVHTKIIQHLSQRGNLLYWLGYFFPLGFVFFSPFFFIFSEVLRVTSLKWFRYLRSWSPEDCSLASW